MALFLVLFVLIFLVALASAWVGLAFLKSKQNQQFRSMLRAADRPTENVHNRDLLRPEESPDLLTKLIARLGLAARLTLLIEQSGAAVTVSKLSVRSFLFALVFGLIGVKIHLLYSPIPSGAAFAMFGAVLPLLLILRKRKKTIFAFEEQFPEALDFISRSMRVGHGFSTSLEMLAADSPDPLGGAFRKVSNDLQLGSSLQTALTRLMILVPLVDVRFFVSSVILQQETGGNLGEILAKLAFVIRERFRLKGHVKAASSHGRITGLVLLLMPVVVTAFIMASNPEYLAGLAAQKIGRILIYGAITGQVLGYFVIKKIINIKV